MDTRNPQIIVHPLWCPKLSPLGSPVPDYNRCIQLIDRIKNTPNSRNKRVIRSEIMALGPKVASIKSNNCNRDDKHQVDDRQHAPNNLIELLHVLTHPIPTIPFSYSRELLTHDGGSHGGVMERR